MIEIRKITANILSYANDFFTRVMYTPNPANPPSHSAKTAPTTAYATVIRRPEKKFGNAPGNLMCLKICQRFAPIERSKLIASLSAERKPSNTPITIGKNVISTIKITFGSML